MAEYVIHNLNEESTYARLEILDADENGVTGQTPTLRIQRISDGLWADFSTSSFVAAPGTPTQTLTEVDATKAPGLYRWKFVRSDWNETDEEAYEFVYNNAGAGAVGDDSDSHAWVQLSSSAVVGEYQFIIYVKESGSGDAIVGCDVDIWTGVAGDPGAVRYLRKTTDGLGRVVAWLDDGDYKIYLHDPTHTAFTYPESVSVSGHGHTTLYGTAFSPGSVPASTIRIYDWEHYADGSTPVEGARVTAWPSDEGSHQTWGGVGHRDYKITATTDENGYWYLDCSPGIEYEFDLRPTRSKLYSRIEVLSSGSSAQLRTLL